MRVTCVRHGRTSWNAQGRWQGHADIGLDSLGMAQAARVGEWLHTQPPPIDAIYSSDLIRARQTAQAIADATGNAVRLDRRLREIDMGDWQGMVSAEVEQWDGERLASVRSGGVTIARPGGESLQQVADRALALFNDIAADPAIGPHVVLVSHGGTIRMLLHALNLLDPSFTHINNTSCTVLTRAADQSAWLVNAFATVDHLAGMDEADDQPT